MRPFISYAKEDRAVARQLHADLKLAGREPWLDVENILGGQDWESTIIDALRKSSHVITLISANSVDKIGYVQKEIRWALDRLDEFPPDAVFVIPVRLDNSVPKHKRLTELQWVDLFPDYQSGLHRLLQSIPRLSGASAPRGAPALEIHEPAAAAVQLEVSPLLSRYPKLSAIRMRLSEPCDACARYRDTIELLVEAGRWAFNISGPRPAELLRADEQFLNSLRLFARELRESAAEMDAVRDQDQKVGGGLIALVNPLQDVRQALFVAATATEGLRDLRTVMRTSQNRQSHLAHPLYETAANALNAIVDEIEKAEHKRETDLRFFQWIVNQNKTPSR